MVKQHSLQLLLLNPYISLYLLQLYNVACTYPTYILRVLSLCSLVLQRTGFLHSFEWNTPLQIFCNGYFLNKCVQNIIIAAFSHSIIILTDISFGLLRVGVNNFDLVTLHFDIQKGRNSNQWSRLLICVLVKFISIRIRLLNKSTWMP